MRYLGSTISTDADDALVNVADAVVVVLAVGAAAERPAVDVRVGDLAGVAAAVDVLVLDALVLVDDGLVDRGHDGLDEDRLLDLDHLGDVGHDLDVAVLLVERVDLDVPGTIQRQKHIPQRLNKLCNNNCELHGLH